MSTRNSSALNRNSGFDDDEAEAELIILISYPLISYPFGILGSKYNRIFSESCQ
jgi:hypothetical protein